jgi:glycosyltransferase involved in cell wall biosynthesis
MTLSVVQVIGNSAIGGAERHLFDLVRGLASLGVDVSVICPRPGPLTEQLAECGIPVHGIEMVRPWPNDEYLLDQHALLDLVVVLREKRPDVVHSHLYPAHLHASQAAQEVGIPAIVQTAHTIIERPGDTLLSQVTAARIIAVSHAAARLLEGVGVPPERIEVIYNGVSPEHFQENQEDQQHVRHALKLKGGPLIGTVSRLSPEKGIDVLLRAVQQVVPLLPSLTVLPPRARETLPQRAVEGVGHPRLGRADPRRRRAVGMDSVDLDVHDDARAGMPSVSGGMNAAGSWKTITNVSKPGAASKSARCRAPTV